MYCVRFFDIFFGIIFIGFLSVYDGLMFLSNCFVMLSATLVKANSTHHAHGMAWYGMVWHGIRIHSQ